MNFPIMRGGFYPQSTDKRNVYDFNIGWKFIKGNYPESKEINFNDSEWERVDLPHGLELLPENSSGGLNYQGPAYYRKQFTIPETLEKKRCFIRFEAIMGRSKIWINGKLASEHFGGYLPIHIDITDFLLDGLNNITVLTDNSNSSEYPPGKPQELLDFCYFGGIYRDSTLVLSSEQYITDANDVRWDDGGGLYFRTKFVSEKKASASCKVRWHNMSSNNFSGSMQITLYDENEHFVFEKKLTIDGFANESKWENINIEIENPVLWTPDSPVLYRVQACISSSNQKLDSVSLYTGVRTFELKGREGLFLNGRPYNKKLFGVNRHQDYPHIGNAIGALLHMRDVIKIKKAGVNFIRAAHYPQDPSFMDYCDRLGIITIVSTPGWQFFNEAQSFQDCVFSDIRQMVRRDRNRPSVMIWESILNETYYPEEFATKAEAITKEEDPDRFTAADDSTPGIEKFDIVYSHFLSEDDSRPVITREWGDSPDNWHDQTCAHRLTYSQGEHGLMSQIMRFLEPEATYDWAGFHSIPNQPRQYLGASLWAGIDCQRGYHPDPFFGGILDMYRREKYSYNLFKSQIKTNKDNKPMVFIANEFSPTSPKDIMVFTNCDELILKINGEVVARKKVEHFLGKAKHLPVVFYSAYTWTRTSDDGKLPEFSVTGLIDGEEVATDTKKRPGRKHHLTLTADLQGLIPVNNGSDIIQLFAEIKDINGTKVPHGNEWIHFNIEGDAQIIGNSEIFTNPVKACFGSAPLLVKTGLTSGDIKITARPFFEGTYTMERAEITVKIAESKLPLLYTHKKSRKQGVSSLAPTRLEDKKKWEDELADVGKQQEEFIDTSIKKKML